MNDGQPLANGQSANPNLNSTVATQQKFVNRSQYDAQLASRSNVLQQQMNTPVLQQDNINNQGNSLRNMPNLSTPFTTQQVGYSSTPNRTDDTIISTLSKKKPYWFMIAGIVCSIIILTAIGLSVFFFSRSESQEQSLTIDDYRELTDTLTNYESDLRSVYEIAEEGITGKINFYMFLISDYIESKDEINDSIINAGLVTSKLADYLNGFNHTDINIEIKKVANDILLNYETYSSILLGFSENLQAFRKAFLNLDKHELESILTSYEVSSKTAEKVIIYEEQFSIIKRDADRCAADSGYSVSDCAKSTDLYWIFRNETENDEETVKELFSEFIRDDVLNEITNVNESIRKLRLLIEAELWQLRE